ncbi:MAG: tripartite tricarboxylate transporter substrate binding protein [Pseudomonadota bacterium]
MLNRRQMNASLLAAGALAASARAQVTGARPITILVPYPPGGPGDMLARSLTETVGERTGRPVIVDYKPGGAGTIAAAALLQQPADGNTLLVAEMSVLCTNKLLYSKFKYDPMVDFSAVALLPQMPVVLYVPYGSPVNSIADLVAASHKRPLNYATQGNGSVGHILGQLLATATGAQVSAIPYRGATPAMTDLIGGQVDFLFDGIGPGLQYVNTQKLKAIAVAGPRRLPQLPNTPTTAEAGAAAVSLTIWFGAVVRAGTSPAIVQHLNEAIGHALSRPKNITRFGELGFQFVNQSPAEFQKFMDRESQKWGAFFKEHNIVLD